MNKTFEIILIIFLTIFSFSLGVKYSGSVKEKAGWIFENGDETPLPDLNDTQNPDMEIPEGDDSQAMDPENSATQGQKVAPTSEDQVLVVPADTTSETAAPVSVPASANHKSAPVKNN